ncbi:MAG: cysteine desulfurase [Gemmatimonadales bacterium]|nr:cysteine desulfurase [Gemmatimonadales bacterium]
MATPLYLDHAASTPVRPEVRDAILPFLGDVYGNPSSAHAAGRDARVRLERARRDIAEALDADPRGVIFTSGGTEADNLAVLGAVLAASRHGRERHVVVSAVEHKAVLAAAHAGCRAGADETILGVDAAGQPDLDGLDQALARRPALVSMMWVNNETGVVLPIADLARRCRAADVPLHTDAVQAVGRLPVALAGTGCAALTVSGHKLGAPKGIGALLLADPDLLDPLQHGGSQQGGLRPGTENVAFAVGLAVAVQLAVAEQAREGARLVALRDDLERRLLAALPDALVVGHDAPRAPHISALVMPGVRSGPLVAQLDSLGVAASSGSACTTGTPEPSHVLAAMGVPREHALGFLRLSLGATTTAATIAAAAAAIPGAVAGSRRLAEALHG